MADTYNRSHWTNDTGIPEDPDDNGTTIDEDELQLIYDSMDEFIARSAKSVGGLWTFETFGAHKFEAAGSGANSLRVRNTSAGGTNKGQVQLMADDTGEVRLEFLSSTFSVSGSAAPNVARLIRTGTGGLHLDAGGNSLRAFSSNLILTHDGTSSVYTNGGALAAYSGLLFGSNMLELLTSSGATLGAQANPALPSWGLDLGGTRGGDGAPWSTDVCAILRRAAGGNWSRLFTVGNTGTLEIADGISANGTLLTGGTINSLTQILGPNGSAATPSVAIGATNRGLYLSGSAIGFAIGGVEAATLTPPSGGRGNNLTVPSGDFGSGNAGSFIRIGRNSNGSGAAGALGLVTINGVDQSIWVDGSGNLRISAIQPLPGGDTGGTVVGTQVSSRAAKDIIERFTDRAQALAIINETPLYRFRYKENHGIQNEEFIGIITDDSPLFGMDAGRSLNVVNAVGLLVSAVQELTSQVQGIASRVERLEARRH